MDKERMTTSFVCTQSSTTNVHSPLVRLSPVFCCELEREYRACKSSPALWLVESVVTMPLAQLEMKTVVWAALGHASYGYHFLTSYVARKDCTLVSTDVYVGDCTICISH